MGNFSRNTFDKLKHYVGVRLQQGVPIVDADWNELEDIRKYELQAFLKWFVGSGIPQGNDGFHILPAVGDNDFVIGAGRCLVEGWDVINESNLNYTEQRLFNEAGLDEAWDVAPLPALTTPAGARTDTVYLDVWEREVNAAEDFDHLVNPAIGIETCVRLKREWVVRVAEGAPPPAPPSGHVFYSLAVLSRTGQAVIPVEAITDQRLTGLAVGSQLDIQQITTDAFGSGYTLDHDGQPDLKVSLRETINALLRGEIPSTPELALTTPQQDNQPFALEDSRGDLWVFWYSFRSGNYDIWSKRYSRATSTWGSDTQLTTDTQQDYYPFALEDSSGDLWVFWTSYRSGNADIWSKRYSRATSAWGSDTQLTTDTQQDYQPFALEDSGGDLWVFWYSSRSGNPNIWYKRYSRATSAWGSDTRLTTATSTHQDYQPFVLEDSTGDIWAFWTRYSYSSSDEGGFSGIWYKKLIRVI